MSNKFVMRVFFHKQLSGHFYKLKPMEQTVQKTPVVSQTKQSVKGYDIPSTLQLIHEPDGSRAVTDHRYDFPSMLHLIHHGNF